MKTPKLILAALCLAAAVSCNQGNDKNQNEMNTENAVIETIMSRHSIRKYKDQTVDRETLNKILECGINAPNALNRQSWEVRVIDKPEVMAEIQSYMVASSPDADPEMVKGCFRGAPVMVVIANDTAFSMFSQIDCGLLAQNIMLSAWSLGVGSVCLGSPVGFLSNSPEAMAKLGFSEGYKPAICVGLGYADETPEAKPRDMGKVRFVE